MRFQFEDFEFDSSTGELKQSGSHILLQPQPAKVLGLLLERRGQTVTRTDLQLRVWGEDTHVDFEQGLNWCIRRVREVLGDTPSNSRFIKTIPRRGYRFSGEITEVHDGPAADDRLPWRRYGRAGIAASILLIILIGARIESRRTVQHPITVLVLPFDNVSDPLIGSEYQDIASDQLMANLARVDPRRLSVIDPMTARKFKNTKECIIEIGSRLGADYVLLGEVEPTASFVKVDAQMFKVSTNRQVWAAEREVERNGRPSVVWNEMASSIAAQLAQNQAFNN